MINPRTSKLIGRYNLLMALNKARLQFKVKKHLCRNQLVHNNSWFTHVSPNPRKTVQMEVVLQRDFLKKIIFKRHQIISTCVL